MVRRYHIETEAIHGNYAAGEHKGSLVPPLYQTSTFVFDNAEQGERRFSGDETGYIYSRLGNPTVRALEERMAVLENGEKALAFASGMAAISALLFYLTKSGDHILCSEGVYGCTFGLLQMMADKHQITHDFSSLSDEEVVRSCIRDNTACIYVETPINPSLRLVDLEMVARVAKEYDISVVVDNTFCSPYLQNPLNLGCDFVVHSATKYIGGHGDVIAGIIVGKKDCLDEIAMTTQKDIGGVLSPFDAWLLIRGLKTLAVRVDRHCDNAKRIAEQLKKHPKVASVYYPGDPDFPQYEIAKRQMRAPGSMISFEIKGDKADAAAVLNRVQLIKLAVSLGDVESLIEHPATMTHSVIPEDERKHMGISDALIRLSVGLENWEDIWADLNHALSLENAKIY